MFKYPKIESLFKRDENFKVTNEIRCPEFENIKKWLITEKIDGTNIRIIFNREEGYLVFRGRTDNAQMPAFLYEALLKMFHIEKFMEVFPDVKEVCLFGEGYGQKIQKGGGDYNKGNSFRLFDVWIDGWWLEWDSVIEIAKQLGIETAPEYGIMTLNKAVTKLKGGYSEGMISIVAQVENNSIDTIPEGIVARAYPMMLFRNGTPIKWKLKVSDYK